MKKAVVTGGTGFIGSHLADLLCARGWEVTVVVRPTSDLRWLEGLPVRCVEADLVTGAGLDEALRGADAVFHVAGVTRARTRADYHRGNQRTTRNLLEAAVRSCPGLERFLYVSSLSAAGPSQPGRPARESDPPRPITFYGTSKLAAEREVRRFGRRLPATIVRPPAVYGPRDANMVSVFRGAERGLFLLPAGGRAPVSLVHVRDLTAGILLAAESPQAIGETYYISGEVTTWREVGRLLEEVVGRRLRMIDVPPLFLRLAGEVGEVKWTLTGRPQIVCRRKVKEILQPSWACSDAKARAAPPPFHGKSPAGGPLPCPAGAGTAEARPVPGLGYRPRVALKEGLAETLDWYRRHDWQVERSKTTNPLSPPGRGIG